MSKKKDIVKFGAPAGVPDYLASLAEEDTSLESMGEYRVLPRLKVIQGTSDGELKRTFDEGDIIIRPGDVLVSKVDKREQVSAPFKFVPVFFYAEFAKWSDLRDSESPMVLERTYDPASALAAKCRNPNTRVEVYPGDEHKSEKEQKKYRNCEHLVFVGFIAGDSDLAGEACVLSFERGEFTTGKNFISAASMRKVPLWSQVWELRSGFRDRGADRKWWGIDYKTPEEGAFIEEKDIEFFRGAREEFKQLHEARRLIVDREEAPPDDSEAEM